MKAMLFGVVFLAAALVAPDIEAQANQISGTWSGSWIPKGGVRDAVTIELKVDTAGKVTGKFLTPASIEFSKASFTARTGILAVEAMDQKSNKSYKLDGKVENNEIKGTLLVNDVSGDVNLIKWTFFGR